MYDSILNFLLLVLLRADVYIIAVNMKEVQVDLGGYHQYLVDQIIV